MTSQATESTPETLRQVELVGKGELRYEATNPRGGVLSIGSGQDSDFTPVELLLAAIAGCASIDVEMITGKRAAAETFRVRSQGDKIRDEDGSHLTNLDVTFDVTFPEGEAGDAARSVLARSIEQSRDRLCTVSRTVALPSPVEMAQGVVRP